MIVVKKMNALGMKALHSLVEGHRKGIRLETVYRWRQKLAKGEGVRDEVKRLLVEATAGTAQPIGWSDFHPSEDQAAA